MPPPDAHREYERATARNRLFHLGAELHARSHDRKVRARLPRIRAVCALSDANLRLLEQGRGSLVTTNQYDRTRRRTEPSAAQVEAMFGSWRTALERAGLLPPGYLSQARTSALANPMP
jgi:hypothetical protein